MTKAVPKEGLRAPLFFIAACAGLLLSAVAGAQTIDRADLQRCAALPSTELKLACFEALAAPDAAQSETELADAEIADPAPVAVPAAAGVAVATEPKPVTGPTPEPARAAESAPPFKPEPVAGDTPAAAAAVEADTATAVPEPTPAKVEADATAPHPMESVTADVSATTIAAAGSQAAPDEYGEEHLQRQARQDEENEEPEAVTARVQKVTTGYANKLYFHFENGQVWRQQASGYIRYPKGQAFDVEITRGMMGDYQMRVDGEGRLTRIVRTK